MTGCPKTCTMSGELCQFTDRKPLDSLAGGKPQGLTCAITAIGGVAPVSEAALLARIPHAIGQPRPS